jgi:hypothetical protein
MLRAGHLAAAAILVVYIYTPAADAAVFAWGVRLLVIPSLVVSGIQMWKPRLGRRRIARPSAARRDRRARDDGFRWPRSAG